jgi:hypothetical protein
MPFTADSFVAERSWDAKVTYAAEQLSIMQHFAGPEDDQDVAFRQYDIAGAKKGTNHQVTFSDIGDPDLGVSSNTVGQEDEATVLIDNIRINDFYCPRKIEDLVLEQQQFKWNREDLEVYASGRIWARWFDRWVINSLAGITYYNSQPKYRRTGGNIVVAPDSFHIVRAPVGGSHATDAAVAGDANAVLSGALIRNLEMRAGTEVLIGKWYLAPCKTPWGLLYVFVVGRQGYNQLIGNTNAGEIYPIEVAKLQGGRPDDDNPFIYSRPVVIYNTLVLRTDFVPRGETSGAPQANTERGVFFGAGAGAWAYGEGFTGGNHLQWARHDILWRRNVTSRTYCGFKPLIPQEDAPVPANERFGAIAVTYYTAA